MLCCPAVGRLYARHPLLITAKTPAAAQTAATETPLQALPTFTPTLDPNAATAAALPAGTEALSGIPTISGTPGDTVMAAYQKAKAVLFKSLNVPLGPVVSYTYTIVAFTDSGLNCALGGTPVKSGFNGGYSFVFTLYKYQNGGGQYEVHTNVDASNIVICQTVGGSTLAGTAAVGLGAPVAGHITGGFEIGGQVQSFSLGTAGHINQAKMKWVKFQFAPGDGGAASAISAAHTQGFKALISLKGAASDISGGAAYFASYAANAATVAQSGADAIEVWNEENLDREWPNGQIDPVLYTQLLSKAFNAIHSANPSTMVILGAPSPTGAAVRAVRRLPIGTMIPTTRDWLRQARATTPTASVSTITKASSAPRRPAAIRVITIRRATSRPCWRVHPARSLGSKSASRNLAS